MKGSETGDAGGASAPAASTVLAGASRREREGHRDRSAGLFPRFVLRVAAASIASLDAQHATETDALLERAFELERDLLAAREEISADLYTWIGGSEEGASRHDAQRKTAVEVRRDLFNLRPLAGRDVSFLPALLRRRVEGAGAAIEELAELRAAVPGAFRREAAAARRDLQRRLDDPSFQRGLLLSSEALFEAQRFYRRANPARLRAKERRVERGLLLYWTRMIAKATPFGAFCRVLPGAVGTGEGEGGAWPLVTGDLTADRFTPRLNKGFADVISRQAARDPELRRGLDVDLNPTLREEAGRLAFLGVSGLRETFQRLPATPPLRWLRERFSEAGGRPTLERLTAELAEATGDAEGAAAYLDKLLEIGLLRLTWSVPAQEVDWDLSMIRRLEGAGPDAAREAAAFLRDQRRGVELYAAAAEEGERAAMYRALERRFAEHRDRFDLRMRVNTPVFEDATAAARAVLALGPDLDAVEAELVRYVDLTSELCLLRAEQAAMRFFHDRCFAGRPVPLLRFYETYYREHYKAHLEAEHRSRRGEAVSGYDVHNPFGLKLVREIRAAHRELATLVGERWEAEPEAEELRLDPREVAAIIRRVEPGGARDGWSVSVYAEALPASPGAPPRLHLRQGGYYAGWGKMFSRFLPLFGDGFTAAVRERNRRSGDAFLAELAEDANFNANLHPWLVESEIRDPLSESRGPLAEIGEPGGAARGRSLLPSDLEVAPHPRDPQALTLVDRESGRRVLPVDVGFISPHARPPLARLLATFQPSPSFNWPLPSRRGAADLATVVVRPRVVFGERLVLHRRTWLVPGALYPRRRDGEGEAAYFERLGLWRRREGLPERAYLRFQALGSALPDDGTREEETGGAEMRKPQLIDFAHPLLALLAGGAAPSGDAFVACFEECLPDVPQLPGGPDGPRVSELVLQVDRDPEC